MNAEIAQMTSALMSFNTKLGMNAASYVGTSGVKFSALDTNANIVRKMGMVTIYKKTIESVKAACKVYLLAGDNPTALQGALGNACKAFITQTAPGPGLSAVCTGMYGPPTGVAPTVIAAPTSSGNVGNTGSTNPAFSSISMLLASCGNIGTAYMPDGVTLVSTIFPSYATVIASSAAWTSFYATAPWDTIARSPFAWINFNPMEQTLAITG